MDRIHFAKGLAKMEKLNVGDVWHGRLGTNYEGVEAKIDNITPRRVQVSFNRLVEVDDMILGGTTFGKKNFGQLFEKQKHEQMNLFETDPQ